jgi:hypothetical protein
MEDENCGICSTQGLDTFVVWRRQRKRPLRRPTCTTEDNIKMYVTERRLRMWRGLNRNHGTFCFSHACCISRPSNPDVFYQNIVSWKHAILCKEWSHINEQHSTATSKTSVHGVRIDIWPRQDITVKCCAVQWTCFDGRFTRVYLHVYRMIQFHDRDKWNRSCYGPTSGVPIIG